MGNTIALNCENDISSDEIRYILISINYKIFYKKNP